MALFQPTNITPSDLSGVGTIDALNNLPVTWQVNGTGNTPMTAYKIDIMMNDTESTLLYSTGQVALSDPFYGADAMGNPQYFTATINAAALAAAGVVNSKDNVYKLLITQWWSAGEFVQQSSASVFIARETPSVSITNFSSTISTVSYEFLGSYSQAQGDPIEWARWQISGSANNDVLVDTGRIYGVGELKTSYDGFLNGNNYIIRLSGQTVNGAEFDTGWQTFVAEYDIEILDGAMTTCVRKDTDAVQITFPTPLYTMGAGGGDWEIISTSTDSVLGTAVLGQAILGTSAGSNASYFLSLPTNADSVTWDTAGSAPFSIAAPFGFVWRAVLTDTSASLPLFSMAMANGILNAMVSSTGIQVTISGQILFEDTTALANGDDIMLYIQKDAWGLFVNGTGVASGSLSNWQDEITSVMLYGPQNCSFVWIVENGFTTAQMLNAQNNTPSYDSTTHFLAQFSDGLSAGAIRAQEDVTRVTLYRRQAGKVAVQKLVSSDPNITAVRDYAALNGNSYTYTLVGETDSDSSTSAISSNSISPCIWNYTLMLCSQDSNGFYHVQQEYRFSLDISSGSENNNNNPTLQANFTRYPLRQPNAQNYRSGTLTSFVGKAVNGKYVDSLSEIEALREISTSSLYKFLKNRKGEIMLVDTASPITMTITDKYEQQPVRATIPWAEIGSAKGKSVITVSGDTYWPNN